MPTKIFLRTLALIIAASGLTGGAIPSVWSQMAPSESLDQARDDTLIEHARKHADVKYVCPMHPQIVRDEPGTCPICGMTLEPKEINRDTGGDFGPPIVTIRPETRQNMGLRTAPAERGALQRPVETVGYVAYDEDRISHVHPRAAGWVEKLLVRAEGDAVRRGQPLLEFYSPEIVNAQEEYLLALEGVEQTVRTRRNLEQSAQRRLRLLRLPDGFIDNLAKTRQVQETVPILAPGNGVVTRIGIREGMYVEPAMELFTISDVASVWVLVDVFEQQLDWVQPGRPAQIRVPALPGRTWTGRVDYVYPEVDPRTRTLRVRLRFDNPDGVLKPNMFAQATIQSRPRPNVVHIPRDALIATGGEERVIVALGDGRFQPRPVTSGLRAGDQVEILSGLQEGDQVVVSGQFLIDSESNLQATFRRMEPLPEPTGQPHAH